MGFKKIAISELKFDEDLMKLVRSPWNNKLFGLRPSHDVGTCQTQGVRTRVRADVGRKSVLEP